MAQKRSAAQPPSSAGANSETGGAAPSPSRPDQPFKKRKSWLRLAGKALGLCVLLCAVALAAGLTALRNESVQLWLTGKINAAMQGAAEPGAAQGVRARITRLAGPLPFGLELGVELYDAKGLWLRLPACSARWDWQALPGAVRIAFVRVDDAQLLRLPQLPDTPSAPTPPLTEASLRAMLGEALRGLGALPGWLPRLRLEELTIANARLPESLLGASASAPSAAQPSASADAGRATAAPDPAASAENSANVQPYVRPDVQPDVLPEMLLEILLNARLTLAAQAAGAQADLAMSLVGAAGQPLPLASAAVGGLEAKAQVSVTSFAAGGDMGAEAAADIAAALLPTAAAQADAAAEKSAQARDSAASAGASLQEPDTLAVLLERGARATLRLTARATTPRAGGQAASARTALETLSLEAGPLHLAGHAAWADGGATSWLAGPLDVDVQASLGQKNNVEGVGSAPEGAARTPGNTGLLPATASMRITLSGPLEAPEARVALACPLWNVGGHTLADAALKLESTPFSWRQALFGDARRQAQPGSAAPARELAVSVQASATVDKFAQHVGATVFARQVQEDGSPALQTGLRDLQCSLLGIACSGQAAATLPLPFALAGLPRIDGKVDVRVADWKALAAMLPGAVLSGDAALSLELRSQPASPQAGEAATAPVPSDTTPQGQLPSGSSRSPHVQQVTLRLRAPRLLYKDANAPAVEVHGLEGEAVLADALGAGQLVARLDLAGLRSGDKKLGVRLRAQGSVYGPLEASLETNGFAAGRCAVRWQPGTLELRRLDVDLPAQKVGLHAAAGAVVHYGPGELGLSNLDISMKPSGRLRAQAVTGPEKLDARLALERLALAPWRVLVPALPAGMVEAAVRLTGSPTQPQGDLRVEARDLALPGTALKPMHVVLTGKLERDSAGGGALALRLTPDQATVTALGGTECRVEARVPLLFDASGLPRPHMQGPLRAAVRWNGAAAPLWSLLPVADQRLAGRLALALDVGGTLEAPAPKGFVRLDDARYENLLLGVLLTGINLRVDLEEGRAGSLGLARLNLAAADGQGGTAHISGQGGLDGSHLDVAANINHFRPLRRRDVRVELSAQATVGGSVAAPQVRGTVTVNQGLVLLNNLDVGGSITTLPISKAAPGWAGGAASPVPVPVAGNAKNTGAQAGASEIQSASGAADGGKTGLLDVRIVIPGRFVVEGFGLKSEWRADLHVGGVPAEPVVSGQLNAVKGSLDILGKNFKLARGAVTFGGGAVSNPLLDIMLTNQTPALTANISIVGTVRKMQLVLSSDPEMPRDEILAQILFGKSASELGRFENLRLAAAVAQLAGFGTGNGGGGVLDAARQALGVDVLRFNSAASGAGQQNGENMAAGSSVEMGKYLTEDIYVGVQQGAKQGSTAFVIQLELTPRANLEVRTEQQSTKGGLTWKYNY